MQMNTKQESKFKSILSSKNIRISKAKLKKDLLEYLKRKWASHIIKSMKKHLKQLNQRLHANVSDLIHKYRVLYRIFLRVPLLKIVTNTSVRLGKYNKVKLFFTILIVLTLVTRVTTK